MFTLQYVVIIENKTLAAQFEVVKKLQRLLTTNILCPNVYKIPQPTIIAVQKSLPANIRLGKKCNI